MTPAERPASAPKPIIVGVESHTYQGDGPACVGVLGYARGDFRHGEVCQAPRTATIHTHRKETR